MSNILDTLFAEHKNFSAKFDVLKEQIRIFERAGEPDYAQISGVVDYFAQFPDQPHHKIEDLIYDRLCELDPDLGPLLGDLNEEHRRLSEYITSVEHRIHTILMGGILPRLEVVDAARSFADFYKSHMALEETRFFPMAERLLKADDWTRIVGKLS